MICIFNKNETVFTYNGLAVLEPSECIFKPSINGVWSLEMTLPYDADGKYVEVENERILKVTGIDCIAEQTSAYQLFRIYDSKRQDDSVYVLAYPVGLDARFDTYRDTFNIHDKTASGALSDINQISQKYTVTGSGYGSEIRSAEYKNANIISILNGDNGFVKVWDGEICYDNYNIKVNHRLASNLSPVDVRYGKNIESMSYDVDNSNVITRLYPKAKSGEILNAISDYKISNEAYVDAPNAAQYNYLPHIYYVTTPYSLVQTGNDYSKEAALTSYYYNQIRTKTAQWLHYVLLYEQDAPLLSFIELDWINKTYSTTVAKDGVEGIVEHMWKYVVTNSTHDILSSSVKNMIFDAMMKGFDDVLKSGGSQYIGSATRKIWDENPDFYSYTWDSAGDYRYNSDDDGYHWLYSTNWRQIDSDGYLTGTKDTATWKWYKVSGKDYKRYGNKDKKRYLHGQWWKINDVWYYFEHSGKGKKGDALKNAFIGYFDSALCGDSIVSPTWQKTLYQMIIPICVEAEDKLFELLYTQMTEYCNNMFVTDGLSYPTPKIEINIVDLSKTTEYAGYENLEKIKLGNMVNVTNSKIGTEVQQLRVTGLTFDVLRGCNTEIQIGVTESSVVNLLDSIGRRNESDTRIISGSTVVSTGTPAVTDVILDGSSVVQNHVAYLDLHLEDIGLQWFEETENALYGISDNSVMKLVNDPRYVYNESKNMLFMCESPGSDWRVSYELHSNGADKLAIYIPTQLNHDTYPLTIGSIMNSDASDRKYFLLLSKENDFPINAVARDYTITNPYSIEYFDFNAKNGSSDTKILPDEYRIWTDGSHISWANNGEVFYFRSSAVVDGETWYGVLLGSYFAKSSSATDIRDYLPAENLQVYDQQGNKGFATIADLIRGVVPLTKEVANDDKYNGISREGMLAFFAGADDEHGTNAPIKIYTNGTYEGLDKVEDVQLEGASLVDENKIAHVDDAVKVKDVKYGNTSLVTDKIAQLDSLQEKLTEGDNVQINNNVISATDTTYSAFEGATSSADGESGLVPKPLIADKDKFLKGDGTWASAGGGGGGNVDDVNVNGVSVVDSNRVAQIKSYKEVTQSEYDALPQSKLTDGVLYCIKDAGGGDGASSLEELDDVNISTPINGQVLSYDSTNDKWINTTPSGGGGSWNYSTTKVDTGQKWIDGRTIYCKVYTWQTQKTNIGNNSWKNLDIPSNDENWDIFINVIGGNQVGVVWNFLSLNYDGANYLQIWNPRSAAIQLKWLAVWFVETTTS